jgi:choline monooxygenase
VIDPVDIDHSTVIIYSMAKAEVAQRLSLNLPANPAGSLVALGAVEDNEMSEGVQRGLHAGANAFVEFGRHESAVGHFHATLDERLTRLTTP